MEKRFVTYRFWDLRRLQGREVAVKMSWGYILVDGSGKTRQEPINREVREDLQ